MPTTGLTWDAQASFAAGAHPGLEEIPVNGAEDIVNGLILDDGAIQRRGGTTHKTTSDTSADIIGLWDGYLIPGPRTLVQDQSGLYILGTDDQTPQQLLSSVVMGPGRFTEFGHMVIRPLSPPNQETLVLAGGARPFAEVNTGTASATQGSVTVTGTGTAWASLPSGSILTISGQRPVAIAASPNATTITLAEPWPAGNASGTYTIRAATTFQSPDVAAVPSQYPAYVASMFNRFLLGNGNRLSFTHFTELVDGRVLPTFDFATTTDFHLLPEGVVITALEPLRDLLVIFTTAGVWALSGLAFDIVDALGNPQQRLEPVNHDLILWGEAGLATWRNTIVVPATEDVYLFDPSSAPVAITGGARRLYRSYVEQGFTPGRAAVYRGHYLLPILDPEQYAVDLLVWRLDLPGVPLVRWAGHGGQAQAFTVRAGSTTRQPDLFGGVSRRVESYRQAFEPSSVVKTDADGTNHEFALTTRTFTAGTNRREWRKLRVRTEQDDVPAGVSQWNGQVATGRPGNAFEVLGTPTIREGR